jgi:hypothetical protein
MNYKILLVNALLIMRRVSCHKWTCPGRIRIMGLVASQCWRVTE